MKLFFILFVLSIVLVTWIQFDQVKSITTVKTATKEETLLNTKQQRHRVLAKKKKGSKKNSKGQQSGQGVATSTSSKEDEEETKQEAQPTSVSTTSNPVIESSDEEQEDDSLEQNLVHEAASIPELPEPRFVLHKTEHLPPRVLESMSSEERAIKDPDHHGSKQLLRRSSRSSKSASSSKTATATATSNTAEAGVKEVGYKSNPFAIQILQMHVASMHLGKHYIISATTNQMNKHVTYSGLGEAASLTIGTLMLSENYMGTWDIRRVPNVVDQYYIYSQWRPPADTLHRLFGSLSSNFYGEPTTYRGTSNTVKLKRETEGSNIATQWFFVQLRGTSVPPLYYIGTALPHHQYAWWSVHPLDGTLSTTQEYTKRTAFKIPFIGDSTDVRVDPQESFTK